MSFSIAITTILALGCATGAALCCMLGLLQWKSGQLTGAARFLVWLWLVALMWSVGGFVAASLGLAGFPDSSRAIKIAMLLAWGPTSVGPALILRAVDQAIPSESKLRRATLSVSTATVTIVLALMAASVFWPRFPLTFDSVMFGSFVSSMLHAGTCGLIYLRYRRKRHDVVKPTPSALRMFRFAVGLISLNFIAGLILFFTPTNFEVVRSIALVIVTQQIIPWAIAAAAFYAESSYADVVLKRSLTLVVSVVIGSVVAWLIPSLMPGFPVVLTGLLCAGLLLVAPSIRERLSWLVDRMLKRPDYAILVNSFADDSRRAANQGELFSSVKKYIEDALHLEAHVVPARGIESGDRGHKGISIGGAEGVQYVLELNVTTQARTLMQEELTFLNTIASETTRRLESLEFERERREQQFREERLRHSLTVAELRALRAQVDPHFLFNTLNTITDLISADPEKAESMTERLSEFFRYTLSRRERMLSTLDEELDFVRQYFDIEQVRFGQRLSIEISCDPSVSQEMVPSLILQPLVENALRHGLAPKLEGGTVSISAVAEAGSLRLQVTDDGVGIRNRSDNHSGVGLENVRERLRVHYQNAAQMSVDSGRQRKGTCVTLLLPRVLAQRSNTNAPSKLPVD